MKHLITIIAFLFISGLGFAQDSTVLKKDMVIFNNGTQLEGKLLEVRKNAVTIKVGSVPFTINKNKIKRIYYQGVEVTLVDEINEVDNVETEIKGFELVPIKETEKRDFYNITYGGISFPNSDSDSAPGLENVTGFQWNQHTGIGLGIGFLKNGRYRSGDIAPLYAEYRGYFTKGKVSTYFNVAMGTSLAFKNENSNFTSSKPGRYFHPAIGYKCGSNDAAFMIDVGFRYTTLTYKYENENFSSEELQSQRAVVLRLGIML